MTPFASHFCVAVVGFTIVTVINLIALFFSKQASAAYFSDGWWSNWFPCYAVFGVFFIVALVKARPQSTKRS